MRRLGGTVLAVAAAAAVFCAPAGATYKGRNGPIYIAFGDNFGQDTRVSNLPERTGFLEVAAPGREPVIRTLCARGVQAPCLPRGMTFAPGGRLVAGSTDAGLIVAGRDGQDPRVLLRNASSASWSPDGRSLAVSDAGDVFTIRRDGTGQRRLTRFSVDYGGGGFGSQGAGAPAWSSGNRIAFTHVRSVRTKAPAVDVLSVDPAGRAVRALARVRDADGLEWSPDGRRLLFVSGGYVHTVDPRGRGHRRLRLRARFATWSPDGRFVAALDRTYVSGGETGSFVIARADGSGRRRYSLRESTTGYDPEAETRDIGSLVWSPRP
jgi:Tol biopolymer transport system component